jgi:LCP family protein required for cell wall assembly
MVAALLSGLVPGAGHWFVGRRRRGLWWFLPFAAVVLVGVVVAMRGKVELVVLLVQPAWLWSFAVLNVGVVLLRIAAAIDAHALAGGRWRSAGAAVTAVLVLVLMSPHLLVGAYAADLLGLLEDVFVVDDRVTNAATQAARYRGAQNRTVATVAAEERGSIVVLSDGVLANQPDGVQRVVTPAFGEIPSPRFSPFEDEVERVTVLLAGGDAGPGRFGLRTDVMIVATLDLVADRAVLFSISRELVGFPMPAAWDQLFEREEERFWNIHRNRDLAGTSLATDPAPEVFEPTGIWPNRINAIYPYAAGTVDAYYPGSPDPAMDALADTLEIALGIPIPLWVLVDMEGFVDLVDAIGGVEVNSLEPMHVTFSPEREGAEPIVIDIDPGRHRLDGRSALAYVRNRSDSNDLVRTRRQRCMLREVAASADPLTILSNFDSITAAVRDHTTTNIPLRLLPDLVEAAGSLDRSSIVTTAFQASARHAPDSNYRGLRIVDVDAVRATVQRTLEQVASGEPAIAGQEDECS